MYRRSDNVTDVGNLYESPVFPWNYRFTFDDINYSRMIFNTQASTTSILNSIGFFDAGGGGWGRTLSEY